MPLVLDVIGLVAVATLFGSMAFFSFVVAPLVFVNLDGASAGRFLRGFFPWYYIIVGLLSLLALGALAALRPIEAATLGLIALGAVISRQILMPRINHHRDRMLEGDAGSGQGFNRLHRLSVWINGAQLLAAFIVLLRLAAA
jgi:hypothetical protein